MKEKRFWALNDSLGLIAFTFLLHLKTFHLKSAATPAMTDKGRERKNQVVQSTYSRYLALRPHLDPFTFEQVISDSKFIQLIFSALIHSKNL